MKYVKFSDGEEAIWQVEVKVNQSDGEIELSVIDEDGEETVLLCITREGKIVINSDSNFAALDIEPDEKDPDWEGNNYIPVEYR